MISETKPTIGRKVWFWVANVATSIVNVADPKQACDATVIFVHGNGTVQLNVVDHAGDNFIIPEVELHDPFFVDGELADEHNNGAADDYATWMPYQKQQADKAKAEQEKTS